MTDPNAPMHEYTECSFCHNKSVQNVPITGLEMKMCRVCFSTFIAARKLPAIPRELEQDTRQRWLSILQAQSIDWQGSTTPTCITHQQPLLRGKIPDYGFEGWVANCCDTLHLPPADFEKILQVGIHHEASYKYHGKHTGKGGFWTFLGKPLVALHNLIFKETHDEDPFAGMQYDLRLKKLLEEPFTPQD
jgi:hypothetical protein